MMVSGSRSATISLTEALSFDYDAARTFFAADSARYWTAYIAGAFIVLARDCGIEFCEGARVLVTSTIPEGKGVSSSAALEVAAMSAICAAYDVALEPRQLALLCQKVENIIAGAPCGVMDQMTAALGQSGQLLALLCQPAEVQRCLELGRGLALWGIDSGIRHAVSGADYATIRAAAFMGHRILEHVTGRSLEYLANVTPAEFATLGSNSRASHRTRVPRLLSLHHRSGHVNGCGSRVSGARGNRASDLRARSRTRIRDAAFAVRRYGGTGDGQFHRRRGVPRRADVRVACRLLRLRSRVRCNRRAGDAAPRRRFGRRHLWCEDYGRRVRRHGSDSRPHGRSFTRARDRRSTRASMWARSTRLRRFFGWSGGLRCLQSQGLTCRLIPSHTAAESE